MRASYVLAPEAALDLVGIWRYLRREANISLANHVESVIRNRIAFLAQSPRAGHRRRDLTDEDVRFFPVYSYLIVYRPQTKPLQIVSILHGRQDVEQILKRRL